MPPRRGPAENPSWMTTDEDDVSRLVRTTVSTALQLPCREALALLRGLLILGGEHDALDPVRKAYTAMNDSEAQLELIARPK